MTTMYRWISLLVCLAAPGLACSGLRGDGDSSLDGGGDRDADGDAEGDPILDDDHCGQTAFLLTKLRVGQVRHPTPVTDGTRFEVSGEGFVTAGTRVTHQVNLRGGVGRSFGEVALESELLSNQEIVGTLPAGSVASLGGPGTFDGVIEVRYVYRSDGREVTTEVPISLDLVEELTPSIVHVDETAVQINAAVDLAGSGFLDGDAEGSSEVVLSGIFESDGGSTTVSDLVLPVALEGRNDRSRAHFLWSARIGGQSPGTFRGTVTPRNLAPGGGHVSGDPVTTEIGQHAASFTGVSPDVASLGQVVELRGGGFIGGPDDGGATSFRITGTVEEASGPATPIDLELFGEWVSGEVIRYPVAVTSTGGRLRSVDFDVARGRVEGTITLVTALGADQREWAPVDVVLTLGPVHQVAWVRFTPGFCESLGLLGLGAVDDVIRQRVVERMQQIYRPPDQPAEWINVELRTTEPDDFFPGGYAIVDIGGTDPNGLGLLGYDNVPVSEAGNLRLHDHVGGENALGTLDGFGYGGIFVESMVFWSEHPPVTPRPGGSPEPDPLFDQVFDPVRDAPVAPDEYPDGASPARLAEIEAAISAISNVIADQAAHAFAHSLGLAQPFGGTDHHNAVPADGCLMDSGQHRPFEERARVAGNPGARFCGENLWYLQDVLPME